MGIDKTHKKKGIVWEIESYGGDAITAYEETDEKKQLLWDSFINWCIQHDAYIGEACQTDDFQIDAPQFMAEAIDEIIRFETEYK